MKANDDGENESGYNQAVDIWSVGCLAGTLLTNTFLFPRERDGHSREATNHDHEPIDLAMAFNLKFLDTSHDWKGMSRNSKSFVRACVIIDDSQRMTVAQALQHPWVAHPSFAAEMHAEYARAIADWAPRANPVDFIEYLKPQLPATKAPEDSYEARLHEEVRSHHFPSQTPPLLSQFRTWNTSVQAKLFGTRLSPIDGTDTQVNKPMAHSRAAAQATEGSLAQHETAKCSADEESSYMSIEDYAPPVILPVSTMNTQHDPSQSQWQSQLAKSMELDERPASGYGILSRKKVRT